jgi:predicted nucleotidyltransferase
MTPVNDRISRAGQEQIIAALAPFQPAVIYLFGSFGTAAQHPASDIDLAFLPTIPVGPFVCFETAGHLSEVLGKTVDLIDLTRATTVMAKEVLRTGIPLAVAEPIRRSYFEMRTLADYARLNEERQPVLTALES